MIEDHLGNNFDSIEEMANHYGLDAHKVFERLQVFWWSVEKALTYNVDNIRKVEKQTKKVEVDFSMYERPTDAKPGTLAYERPDLLEEWDYEKNIELGLDPKKLGAFSHKKAWWKCKTCGRTRLTSIATKVYYNTSCAVCVQALPRTIEESLLVQFPVIVEEFDYTKNKTTPDKIKHGSHNSVWWKCKTCGHEWQATVASRTRQNKGCPACKNRVVTATNNLQTVRPDLAEEFDCIKNDTTPDRVMAGSQKRVWWKCKTCGHEWQAYISLRHHQNSGCPQCSKHRRTSFPEQALFYYIKHYFSDAINNDKSFGFELDIYIPSINTAIEYDGTAWHKDRAHQDMTKNTLCKKNSVRLIRIRELGLDSIQDCEEIYIKSHPTNLDLEATITYVIQTLLGKELLQPVNVSKDLACIEQQVMKHSMKNSLESLYPDIAQEFISEKNGITPDKVAAQSSKKYWWKCKKCNREYVQVVNMRTLRGSNCTYCYNENRAEINRLAHFKSDKSLLKLYPELIAEYSTSNKLTPENISAKSSIAVEWKCLACNKTYIKPLANRTHMGVGCPHCGAGRHPEFRQQRRHISTNGELIISNI